MKRNNSMTDKGRFRAWTARLMVGLSLMGGAGLLGGCIENDMPYPYIKLFISGVEVDGQLGNAQIDNDNRTATVTVDETVNLKKVHVKRVTVSDGGRSSIPDDTLIDLTKPQPVTLSLYQDYYWTLVANQTIERLFRVENQVGTASFDPNQRIASVNVSKSQSLRSLALLDLKLGPEGSTIDGVRGLPALSWEVFSNYAKCRVKLNFRDFIVDEEWTLYVFQVESNVSTTAADGWVNVAWLYGQGMEGADCGFEIKEEGLSEWSRVDSRYVTQQGGSFHARVPHLKAETNYRCRAYSGEERGEEISFTTGQALPLPGGGFDEWHQEGKVWNPWAEGATPVWDSGNDGATTLGESITVPTSDVWSGARPGSTAARLGSKFVGIGSIGKFAAGNLFMGEYVRTDGTNGVLAFGRPFTARPTRLRGYFKYTTAPVDCLPSKSNTEDYNRFLPMKNEPDTCAIYIALGDWDTPVEIRTNPKDRKLFDHSDPHLIAYAEYNSGSTISQYTLLDLELEYRSTSRVPKYILVVGSASKYGDYFVGGEGATLWMDDFSLEYDDK